MGVVEEVEDDSGGVEQDPSIRHITSDARCRTLDRPSIKPITMAEQCGMGVVDKFRRLGREMRTEDKARAAVSVSARRRTRTDSENTCIQKWQSSRIDDPATTIPQKSRTCTAMLFINIRVAKYMHKHNKQSIASHDRFFPQIMSSYRHFLKHDLRDHDTQVGVLRTLGMHAISTRIASSISERDPGRIIWRLKDWFHWAHACC